MSSEEYIIETLEELREIFAGKGWSGYVEAMDAAVKAIKETEEKVTVRLSRGILKKRVGRFVIYDVEWLKEHYNTTEAALYGQRGRGIWTHEDEGVWICGECGEEVGEMGDEMGDEYGVPQYNFCPYCGADMTGRW